MCDKNIDGRDYKATNSSQAIKIEKNSASFSFYKVENDKVTDSKTGDPFTANSNTVYVDVENNRVFTGYRNVPGMTSKAGGFVVLNDGVVEIVFLTDAGSYDVDDDSFFFVKSTNDKEVVDTEDGDRYDWTVYVNGAKETISLTKGASSTIGAPGLYKIESTNSKDWIDDVTKLVTDFSASQSYATYAEKELLKLKDADSSDDEVAGDLTGANNDTFAYNSDTTFMVVELDKKGNPDDVRTGNYNDIETDRDGRTAVYVANVEDKTDDTPLATLVLVIVPYEGTTSGGQGPATDNQVIVNRDGTITYKVGKGESIPGMETIRQDVVAELNVTWDKNSDEIENSGKDENQNPIYTIKVNGATYKIYIDDSANNSYPVTASLAKWDVKGLPTNGKAKAGDTITLTFTQKDVNSFAVDKDETPIVNGAPEGYTAKVTKAGVVAVEAKWDAGKTYTKEEYTTATSDGNKLYILGNGGEMIEATGWSANQTYFKQTQTPVEGVKGEVTVTFTMPESDVTISSISFQ